MEEKKLYDIAKNVIDNSINLKKMKIIVDFAQSWYLLEFEPFLGKRASKYQKAFEKWYYEEYSEIIDGKRLIGRRKRSDLAYEYFDINPIIDWMKEVSPNSNPKVIGHYILGEEYDKKLPTLYF